MKRSSLNSRAIERIMANLLKQVNEPLPETLSPAILAEHHLMPLTDALRNIHFPVNAEMLRRKAQYPPEVRGTVFTSSSTSCVTPRIVSGVTGDMCSVEWASCLIHFTLNICPFELTGAQKRVLKEIRRDLGSGRQMNRLLQGDVGSGKTLVALMSMLTSLGQRISGMYDGSHRNPGQSAL